jgi:hypothetical protein
MIRLQNNAQFITELGCSWQCIIRQAEWCAPRWHMRRMQISRSDMAAQHNLALGYQCMESERPRLHAIKALSYGFMLACGREICSRLVRLRTAHHSEPSLAHLSCTTEQGQPFIFILEDPCIVVGSDQRDLAVEQPYIGTEHVLRVTAEGARCPAQAHATRWCRRLPSWPL